jgi:hypothetical protein
MVFLKINSVFVADSRDIAITFAFIDLGLVAGTSAASEEELGPFGFGMLMGFLAVVCDEAFVVGAGGGTEEGLELVDLRIAVVVPCLVVSCLVAGSSNRTFAAELLDEGNQDFVNTGSE